KRITRKGTDQHGLRNGGSQLSIDKPSNPPIRVNPCPKGRCDLCSCFCFCFRLAWEVPLRNGVRRANTRPTNGLFLLLVLEKDGAPDSLAQMEGRRPRLDFSASLNWLTHATSKRKMRST